MSEEAKTMSRDEVAKLAAAEAKERAQRCFDRIGAILKEENCQLGAAPKFVPAGNGTYVLSAEPFVNPQ